MSDRQALIAKIHIAKKAALVCSGCSRTYFGSYCPDCGSEEPQEYTDEEYRNTLAMLTGLTSCADMSDADLQLVGDYYDKAGFKEAHPYISPDAEHRRQRRAVMWHIKRKAPEVLGPNWESRVEGFVRNRIGKNTLEWCDADELRKVIGWLNRTTKHTNG